MVLICLFLPLFDTFLLSWRSSVSASTGCPSSTTLRTCKYGDTDIAAVSYFPNYNKSPRESFVYFENKDGKYTANTFRTCISGRWLTMDAGDVDGDIDLALGNYTYGPDKAIFVLNFLMKTWEPSGPPVMILYNTLHSKPAKR